MIKYNVFKLLKLGYNKDKLYRNFSIISLFQQKFRNLYSHKDQDQPHCMTIASGKYIHEGTECDSTGCCHGLGMNNAKCAK